MKRFLRRLKNFLINFLKLSELKGDVQSATRLLIDGNSALHRLSDDVMENRRQIGELAKAVAELREILANQELQAASWNVSSINQITRMEGSVDEIKASRLTKDLTLAITKLNQHLDDQDGPAAR